MAVAGDVLQVRAGFANEIHKKIPAGLKVMLPISSIARSKDATNSSSVSLPPISYDPQGRAYSARV